MDGWMPLRSPPYQPYVNIYLLESGVICAVCLPSFVLKGDMSTFSCSHIFGLLLFIFSQREEVHSLFSRLDG